MLDPASFILLLVLLFIITAITIAVAVIVIVSNRKLMNANNNKQQHDPRLEEILDKLSELPASSNKDNTDTKKDLMITFVKLRTAIKETCVTAMNEIGAARLAIYLFHNGTHSTHGVQFFKMSCICEKVAIGSGVKERMIEHTNIPINLFDDMIEKLNSYNRYIIMNDKDVHDTDHKLFISADKISYVQLVTIYDINNNMLGFVAAEMDTAYSKDTADTEKKVLNDLAKQLTPVLSYSDYTSLKT